MQKLQEHLNEIKSQFHLRHGFEFGFESGQSEAYFDITTQATINYGQQLAMSGKINELKDMMTGGVEAVVDSPFFQELIKKCVDSYYGLQWENEKKETLAKTILATVLNGLKEKFETGGYSKDVQGVMSFMGIDSGVLGMLGKMGGMFGGLGKWFK